MTATKPRCGPAQMPGLKERWQQPHCCLQSWRHPVACPLSRSDLLQFQPWEDRKQTCCPVCILSLLWSSPLPLS